MMPTVGAILRLSLLLYLMTGVVGCVGPGGSQSPNGTRFIPANSPTGPIERTGSLKMFFENSITIPVMCADQNYVIQCDDKCSYSPADMKKEGAVFWDFAPTTKYTMKGYLVGTMDFGTTFGAFPVLRVSSVIRHQ